MKTVCIIQARMGSIRFPGKNLAPILNLESQNPVCALEMIHNACMKTKLIDEVIIACPVKDYVAFRAYAQEQEEYTGKKFFVFGGPEDDVYTRTLLAAKEHRADVIVDITGDCPLISVYELKRMLEAFWPPAIMPFAVSMHYMSNVFPDRKVPDGMDIQIYSRSIMEYFADRIQQKGHSGWNIYQLAEHTHILPYPRIMARQERYGGYRITLETREDLEVIRKVAPYYMDNGGLDTRKKFQKFLFHLEEQPEEFWDNSKINAKIAGEG